MRDGYAGTTINAIADEAGVSPESVYGGFGNKRQLLLAVLERAGPSADDSAAVVTEEWLAQLAAEGDARRRLALMSELTRGALERSAPLNDVLHVAARFDPELRALEAEVDGRRRSDIEMLVAVLAEVGPLRLPKDEAVDLMWALGTSDVYLRLRQGAGWTAAHADAALEDLLARLLLRAG